MKISLKKRFLLLAVILFFCFSIITAFGQEIRYFTQDITVEIITASDRSIDDQEKLSELSRLLPEFFINFKYKSLMKTLLGLVKDDDRYGLKDVIVRAIRLLDNYKENIFSNIQVNPRQFYEFKTKESCCFATLTIDVSNTDLRTGDVDLMLMGMSLGMTASGPYYLGNDEYILKCVSLNWMMTSQFMVSMITGGPGGLPVQPVSPVLEKDYAIDSSVIATPLRGIVPVEKIKNKVKESIDVFILDTLPEITAIYEGYTDYESVNKIIKDIFSFFGTHHSIEYFSGSDPDFHTYTNEKYGNRILSDHGLFIAGIIHLISPPARLHLVEVMNHYAAGTMDSLIWGFQRALSQVEEGKPFVVNASLTTKLRFPEEKNEYNEESSDMAVKIVYGITKPELLLCQLYDITRIVNDSNGVVIAAAGNDSDAKNHYDAGYPARFRHVIGVGSARRDGWISDFSNKPGPGGVLAFGGEVDIKTGKTKDGILSIYLSSPYTDSTDINTTGFAVWAGSSFSTGIVSGEMASLLSAGYSISDSRNNILVSCYPLDGFDVLPVKQGP